MLHEVQLPSDVHVPPPWPSSPQFLGHTSLGIEVGRAGAAEGPEDGPDVGRRVGIRVGA